MRIKEIEDRIDQIKEVADDAETAHSLEDDLYEDFIKYISTLKLPIAKKAKLVLTTNDIEFPRWCA